LHVEPDKRTLRKPRFWRARTNRLSGNSRFPTESTTCGGFLRAVILPQTLRCQERQGLAQLQHDFNPCFSQTRSALFLPLRSGHSILTPVQGAMRRGLPLPVPDQDGPADVPAKPGLASARDPETRAARHGATANVGHRAIPRIPRADPSWISEVNMA